VRLLNLGCGHERLGKGEIRLDISPVAKPDVLAKAGYQPLPFKDECFDVVRAHHVLEHIPKIGYRLVDGLLFEFNPLVKLFNEVWRILKSGGRFEITVPIYPHEQAFTHFTHVSIWTPDSFRFFSRNDINAGLYGIECDFKVKSVKRVDYCAVAVLLKE